MKLILASGVLVFALSAYATSPIPKYLHVKECLATILPPDFEFPDPAPTSFEEVKAFIKEKLPEFRAKLVEHFKKAKEEAEAAGGDQPAGGAVEGAPEKRERPPLRPPPGPVPPPPNWIRDCLQAAVGDDVELPENMPPNLGILHRAIMGITGHFPPPKKTE